MGLLAKVPPDVLADSLADSCAGAGPTGTAWFLRPASCSGKDVTGSGHGRENESHYALAWARIPFLMRDFVEPNLPIVSAKQKCKSKYASTDPNTHVAQAKDLNCKPSYNV
jgi:hypothetical protein